MGFLPFYEFLASANLTIPRVEDGAGAARPNADPAPHVSLDLSYRHVARSPPMSVTTPQRLDLAMHRRSLAQ
jgi:hypothetical protein